MTYGRRPTRQLMTTLFIPVANPGELIFSQQDELSPIAAVTSPQDEAKTGDGNILSKKRRSVAAHLQSLRTDDPFDKGLPRSIKREL